MTDISNMEDIAVLKADIDAKLQKVCQKQLWQKMQSRVGCCPGEGWGMWVLL